MVGPSGTVTFLFTDIEGSTRRWEADHDAMRSALAVHDEVLRSAVEANGGHLFKHTGDGMCAAFDSARAAIDAAVEAQRRLELPVRMGAATGEAQQRDGDYFGPVVNRAARVMAAGHGGQIVVAASTASVVEGVELVDLGEHRLRDLADATRLFQVSAEGLASEFPRLRTLDAVPGNLPVQVTSFVGRSVEVKELTEQVRAHRLVTLTGVGGVGKTRLAIQVAAELAGEFGDGLWLVELAPVGEPTAVPDVVAAALGVTPQAGLTVTDSLVQALSRRSILIVLDNCEHVLEAAGDLVQTILARTETVRVLATSREGLGLPAEHLWPVPPLDVAGVNSSAVELFVERARAVKPGFGQDGPGEAEAVAEICRRLDGIALAIELAAARLVSMTAQDLCDRLDDRFRLLSGSRRGLERHQTLRNTIQWSFDLLDDDERQVLACCSVFADGFDLAAATHLCGGGLDEYTVLDRLDSLVRKSLLTVEQVGGHARYGMLETVRQFAEEQLAATGATSSVRDVHARYFAGQAIAHWDIWDGPQQRVALDWVDVEFANLRVGFRWAVDQGDFTTATAIAAHATWLAANLLRLEAVGWSEEILDAAVVADVPQLPRLYTAASLCSMTGQPETAVSHAQAAVELGADPRYDPFPPGAARWAEFVALAFCGRMEEEALHIATNLVGQPGLAHVVGLTLKLLLSPVLGRADEARAIADEALAAARAHGNPFFVAAAADAYGRAFADTEPARALNVVREALDHSREHRLLMWAAILAREAAGLEGTHGDPGQALELFETAISSLQRAGDVANQAIAFAGLAVLFDRLEQPAIAATLYGASNRHGDIGLVRTLPTVADHLRDVLGEDAFDDCVATGAAMDLSDATQYAQHQIQLAGDQLRRKT